VFEIAAGCRIDDEVEWVLISLNGHFGMGKTAATTRFPLSYAGA
jgi:hypothetical protein